MASNSSRLRPEPTATQVSGLSARCTGIWVSWRRRSSRFVSRLPPPARTMPRSMMSAASSGGVLSSVDLIASMIWLTGPSSAWRISSLLRITVLGRPVSMSRPLTSACTSSLRSNAEPTSSLISSAVCWPTSSLYSVLMWLMIASSISSPPTLRLWLTTMPPSEMTATSVVPPPTSTIMFPVGSPTGRPAPIAAAIGSSIRYACLAPALSVASSTARFSTPVTPDGTHTTTRGCAKRCWCTFWMKWRSICSVTSKSAMTPSFSGRIAEIVPGVRPSIRFASTPTACTSPERWSIATTEGSDSTIPRPRTYTSVFAVPRSTAMSRPPKPVSCVNMPIGRDESSDLAVRRLHVAPSGLDLAADEAPGEVVVDDADRLHRRIDRGRTDEREAAGLQLLCQLLRIRGGRDHVGVAAGSALRPRPEAPDELGQRYIVAHRDGRLGVPHDRFELAPVSDHPRIPEQRLDLVLAERRDAVGIEAREGVSD